MPQASPQQIIMQNAQLRAALLASAPRMRKYLGAFTGQVLGGTQRVKLFNVGITTRIMLDISATVTLGATNAVLSSRAPYNLISQVKLTDYDGTDRVNASGYQLFVLECVRRGTYAGYTNSSATQVGTTTLPASVVLTASGDRLLQFQLEVPLAYGQNDLRGALLTQTAVGEAYLNITFANSLLVATTTDEGVYTATASAVLATGTTITCKVYQEYLLPQPIAGSVPLPTLDLMTVYELAGNFRSSDNFSSGSEKLLNYPNVRSVIGAYFNVTNNSLLYAADDSTYGISKFRLIVNGNNVLQEYGPTDKLWEQRLLLNSDTRKGTYFWLHRERPIETALFGNVQLGITPVTVAGTSNCEILFESFYTKGSSLPGMSQAS